MCMAHFSCLCVCQYLKTCTQGYFYMAQARHSMGGPSSVSSLQYDGGMTSLVHTTSTFDAESYNDLTKLVTPGKELNVEFQIDRIDPSKPIKSGDSQSKETISQQNGESQLRRRNVGKESSLIEDVPLKSEPTVDGKAGSQDEQKKEDTCETKSPVKDPLKWFGILVPPYLRRSQGHFCQGKALPTIPLPLSCQMFFWSLCSHKSMLLSII